ncbi:general secretion pathway protein GspB [Desulfoluna sp.]|uniref:general secretion pathway protein GspB n=1 Tax=Desulfoluna sp. TaxID=2045199 RepID=UPI002634A8CC|nr:general secretion pathway protein GspB [Desulfoluna sp.]
MSSVLEALKRMEEDQRRGGVTSFSEVADPKPRGKRRFLSLFSVFVAGVGVAVAGVYLVQGLVPSPSAAVVVPASVAVKAVAAPVDHRSDHRAAFTKAPEKISEKTSVFRVVAPGVPPETGPVHTPTAEKISPDVGASAPMSPQPPLQKIIQTDPPKETVATAGVPPLSEPDSMPGGAAPDPSSEEVRNLPAADASTYHLQGVRWSATPSRRIAVINSQIMREGAGVDGAKVVMITADGVVLDVAGVRQFLPFGHR